MGPLPVKESVSQQHLRHGDEKRPRPRIADENELQATTFLGQMTD